MRKILLLFILTQASTMCFAQLAVSTTETPAELILNTFMGQNTSISNIKFNGSTANAQVLRDQMGRYSNGNNGPMSIGSAQGLVLCTGKAIVAAGMNNTTSASNPSLTAIQGDSDLDMITSNTVRNTCVVEFDFIPVGNTILFDYIFSSEEYNGFVNSQFNDIFGLFLSGPGISGPYSNNSINIATIPGTSLPVAINNVNNGTQNLGPCEFCQFYVDNPLGEEEFQFNGRTTQFTASAPVTTGETYHLKFAIANIGDNGYDSGMFLTAGSFRAATLGTDGFAAEKVTLFPNPATDVIHIKAAQTVSAITLYDIQGRALIAQQTNGNNPDLNIESLSSGTYVVVLELTTNEKVTQKLVIR